jgi:hypothetical protein
MLRDQLAASGRDALLLFAADRISNVRALRVALDISPEGEATPASPEKIRHYDRSVELLTELEPKAALVRRLRDELDQLDAPRCRASARPGRPVGRGDDPRLGVWLGASSVTARSRTPTRPSRSCARPSGGCPTCPPDSTPHRIRGTERRARRPGRLRPEAIGSGTHEIVSRDPLQGHRL